MPQDYPRFELKLDNSREECFSRLLIESITCLIGAKKDSKVFVQFIIVIAFTAMAVFIGAERCEVGTLRCPHRHTKHASY